MSEGIKETRELFKAYAKVYGRYIMSKQDGRISVMEKAKFTLDSFDVLRALSGMGTIPLEFRDLDEMEKQIIKVDIRAVVIMMGLKHRGADIVDDIFDWVEFTLKLLTKSRPPTALPV